MFEDNGSVSSNIPSWNMKICEECFPRYEGRNSGWKSCSFSWLLSTKVQTWGSKEDLKKGAGWYNLLCMSPALCDS